LGDRRHRNPRATHRALLSAQQRRALQRGTEEAPPDGGMWNSRKVGEWIECSIGRELSNKKQRGWEYLKRMGQSPKVPRPHHAKSNEHEQEAFKKDFHRLEVLLAP
jgi:transposase